MPGMLRKSMLYLGLVDDEGEYDEAEGYDEGYATPTAAAPRHQERLAERPRAAAVRRAPAERPERVLHQGPAERTAVTAVAFDLDEEPEPAMDRLARITTLHPRTYNDARTIGEQFRAGVPVIINLTDMDDADAKRLVDFSAGLTFGLRGRIEKVTRSVFLLSPEGVAVQLDDAAGVVEGGFYNQS